MTPDERKQALDKGLIILKPVFYKGYWRIKASYPPNKTGWRIIKTFYASNQKDAEDNIDILIKNYSGKYIKD